MTASSAIIDKVAVNVMVLAEISAMDALLEAKETVGELSSSEIVIFTLWLPLSVASAPDTEEIATVANSSPS